MKNPIVLNPESVEILSVMIVEEILKGQNTYKSDTEALREKIKKGVMKTISFQELTMKQSNKVSRRTQVA
jgi:hypothetical protein